MKTLVPVVIAAMMLTLAAASTSQGAGCPHWGCGENGRSLNGIWSNGVWGNGSQMQGSTMQGVNMQGARTHDAEVTISSTALVRIELPR